MNDNVVISKRLGVSPVERGTSCALHRTCPDVFALSNGDFAIIGMDATDALSAKLPSDAGCGPNERIIVLPRSVLLAAKRDIPDA
jgi:hypothetical protein